MVAFSIFGFNVYWYGIFYFISFLLCYGFLFFLWKKQIFQKYPDMQNILTEKLDGLMIALLLGVMVGGRLGHFLIYYMDDLLANPLSVFQVWKGGMSFIGWIIGVSCSLLIFKKISHISFQAFLLLLSCLLTFVPLWIFFWRFWNYLNQELYGIVFNQSWWSEGIVELLKNLNFLHVYPQVDQSLRINTNLLSMIFEGITLLLIQIFSFFFMVKRKQFQPVRLIAQFVLWYSFFRFCFEYLRNDSQAEFIGIFTKSQWFFLFFFLFWMIFFITLRKKNTYSL